MLPEIVVPEYTLNLPSSDEKIIYRPYLVKEDKIMKIAGETKDPEQIKTSIRQVIKNCLVSPIDVDKLPLIDIEYLLLNMKMQSAGGTVPLEYVCNNKIHSDDWTTESPKEVPCNTPFTVDFDLTKVKIIKDPDEKKKEKISISNNMGIKLKYPIFSTSSPVVNKDDIKTVAQYIDFIWDKDQTYSLQDSTPEEIEVWLGKLNFKQKQKIFEYVNSLPYLKGEVEHTCKKCGFLHSITISDLQSFFTYM